MDPYNDCDTQMLSYRRTILERRILSNQLNILLIISGEIDRDF